GYDDPDGDGWSNLQEYQNGSDPGGFNTPPTPTGLRAEYNSVTGDAVIKWNPSSGPVTGYTLHKAVWWLGEQTDFTLSANATSQADYVPSTPSSPVYDGPNKRVYY